MRTQSSSRTEENQDALLDDIKQLSGKLTNAITDLSDKSTLDLNTLRSVKYSLKMAIASTKGSRVLPEKDIFEPNQNMWTETAKRMGVQNAPKRKRLPENQGISEWSIGSRKGKRTCIHNDLYAGGERSGRRAKPDAVSATVNACVHAAIPSSSVPGPSALASTHAKL